MPASQRRLITASERQLLTVLFTDIVGSTELAVEMGDARWREVIARHHRIVRGALKRFGGREIDTAGDGFFATFDKPTQAIRCAATVVEGVRDLGIEIRAGLHLGEVEVSGKHVGGVAVHTGARVLAAANPGEVLVTATLRELVAGSGLEFRDRDAHELKGVPGTWHLFALERVDGRPVSSVADPSLASEHRAAIAAPTLLRRTRRPAAIAGLTLGILGVAVLILNPDAPVVPDASQAAAPPPLGSVIRVDPVEGLIERMTPNVVFRHGGGNPKIVVAEGGVWVRSNILVHLDPATGRPKGREALIETTGNPRADRGVEVGYRTVWMGGDAIEGTARLLRWNPSTDERLPDARIRSHSPTNDVALGAGGIWALFPDGRLVELDADTREIVGEGDSGDFADQVVFGAGGVWVLDIVDERLTKIDPRTFERTEVAAFNGSVLAMAADQDHLWLLDAAGDAVLPVNPDGAVRDPIPVGSDPSGIAVGLGAVWVSDEGGNVYRIDPITSGVTSIHPGGHLTAIAVDEGGGSLWLTVGGD
jgi:class 3 adenylate cyclase/streptogramin lyase